jgi:hypothetical protein
MKTGIWILTIGLAASAWAQLPAQRPLPAAPGAAKPSGVKAVAKPAAISPKPTLPALSAKAATGPAAQQPHPAAQAKQVRRKRVAEHPAAIRAVTEVKPGHRGRRDPFVSPIVERSSSAAICTGIGKRCLYIGDISLRGIVQSPNGVLAVVMSGEHTYFLREHDPLADGEVERITGNAITLRQRSFDALGRPVVREVTRKIGTPAV